eukprot:scaffold454_cov146-Chaetoceros_neogracile.AAC.3
MAHCRARMKMSNLAKCARNISSFSKLLLIDMGRRVLQIQEGQGNLTIWYQQYLIVASRKSHKQYLVRRPRHFSSNVFNV